MKYHELGLWSAYLVQTRSILYLNSAINVTILVISRPKTYIIIS